MNFSFYIFGTPDGRYNQYPDDYIAPVIKNMCEDIRGSRLVIHREMNLVHYTYFERIDEANFIGFCLIFNNARISKPKAFIGLCRRTIEDIIIPSGKIIRYDAQGVLRYTIKTFSDNHEEYKKIKTFVEKELDGSPDAYGIEPLKDIFNGTKTIGVSTMDISDEQILELTEKNNTVIINGEEGIEAGYIDKIISELRENNNSSKKKIEELEAEILKVNRQKKQVGWVALLSVIVFISFIGILLLNSNVLEKESEISALNIELSHHKDSLSECISAISELRSDLQAERIKYNKKENELAEVRAALRDAEDKNNSLKTTYPILITKIDIGNTYYDASVETDFGNTIYSRNTMYLTPRIEYVGINTNSSINLKVKWFYKNILSRGSNSPEGFSQQQTIAVYNGTNTRILRGWGNREKGHWESGAYRIEIWYNDICLKAKTFTIY